MNRLTVYRVILSVVFLLVLSGCDALDQHDHHAGGHDDHAPHNDHDNHGAHDGHAAGEDHHGHGDPDVPAVAVTHFTDLAELFVEFPVFSVGNESPFAAHLTWLDSFRPVAASRSIPRRLSRPVSMAAMIRS